MAGVFADRVAKKPHLVWVDGVTVKEAHFWDISYKLFGTFLLLSLTERERKRESERE
jgi:hypothetical protein